MAELQLTPTQPESLTTSTLPSVPLRIEEELSEAAKAVSKGLLQTTQKTRVGIAQITTDPGNIQGNTEKIVRCIHSAREQGCDVVVFNELAIPGYCSMDLLYNKSYLKENLEAIQTIRKASEGITVVVGFVDTDPEQLRSGARPTLYNSAAVIHDGVLVGVQDKTLLPTYDIFFEERYFAPPREAKVLKAGDIRLATTICEDIWANTEHYQLDPVATLSAQGADLLVNLSASPFHLGKHPTREALVKDTAIRSKLPVVYSNLVGGFDGYEGEVIFDGRSIVTSAEGKLLGQGAPFREELYVVDIQRDAELEVPQMEQTEELYEALTLGIKDYFRRLKVSTNGAIDKAIIGLSGGIDSAVVAALAVDALGAESVMGITLPSKYSSSETRSDAEVLAEHLGIDFRTIPIQGQVDGCMQAFKEDPELAAMPENVAEENVQARLRMIDLMFYANKYPGLVLNTGNKTELALNNCTIYGDMVGGFSVLGDVDKDRVYDLAEHINQKHGSELIPTTTITRPPSAELKPDQTDDLVMGDSPQRLAPMVREIIEQGLSATEAKERFADQFPESLIEQTFRKLDASEWKRRQSSPGIRVTPRAFGNGRRMPMGHHYYK